MKIKYRQANPWGCGLFAIANLFDDAKFINPGRLEKSEVGISLSMLSTVLKEEEWKYEVEPVWCDLTNDRNPPIDFCLRCMDENYVFPLLLAVKNKKENLKTHMVSAIGYYDFRITILDSYKEESISTTWSDLFSLKVYPSISGVFGFADRGNPDGWLVFPKDANFVR